MVMMDFDDDGCKLLEMRQQISFAASRARAKQPETITKWIFHSWIFVILYLSILIEFQYT